MCNDAPPMDHVSPELAPDCRATPLSVLLDDRNEAGTHFTILGPAAAIVRLRERLVAPQTGDSSDD